MPRTTRSRTRAGLTLFLVLLVAALALAIVFGLPVTSCREWLLSPFHLLQQVTGQAAGAVTGGVARIVFRWHAAGENAALRQRLIAAQSHLARVRAELQEARRKLAGLSVDRPSVECRRVVANVIAGEASVWRESVVVAAGSRSGVKTNMAVVWSGSAVGRVVSVGPVTCRVLLCSDPTFRAGVRFARNGICGVLAGRGAGRCRVDFVPHHSDVRQGDPVVTAGMDRVFPPNFLVGTCTRSSPQSGELTLTVDVKPSLRGRDLEAVEVLLWEPLEDPPPLPDAVERRR